MRSNPLACRADVLYGLGEAALLLAADLVTTST